MATQISNYQCPACTGPLHFDGNTGRCECDFCGSSYDVSEIEALYAQKDQKAEESFEAASSREPGGEDWDLSGISQGWGEDAAAMRAYTCPSCGAELICDQSTAATSCPYCGNPTIVPGQFANDLKPDYVIPFRLSKEQAVAAMKQHYKGKRLLPNNFTQENHVQEIKGVYVPFWLFDGEAQADMTFETTTSSTVVTKDERITTTRHYDVRRAGTVPFEKIPVDASSKMPDEYMDAIEPFDYSELKPFSRAYLPGFLADRYDVTVEDSANRADLRAAESAVNTMRNTVQGYESCVEKSRDVQLSRGKVHYALMPVWMLSTQYAGKNYLFAINGQTGATVSDLPVDKGKYWRYFAGFAAAFGVVFGLLLRLFL